MEINTAEIVAVACANAADDVEIVELNELQLSLIGGGTGDVSLG